MKHTIYAILLLQCLAFASSAQSPFIDSTFGNNGRFTYNFSTGTEFSRLSGTALLPDGKILGVGETVASVPGTVAAVVRCNADGTLDASFGNGGEWISDDQNFVIAGRVVVQPDQKILLAGFSYGTFKVVRLMPDGIYDPSFGVGGKANFTIWPISDLTQVFDMILQPDGKILISGYTPWVNDRAIVRLKANGTLDGAFGVFGKVIIKPSFFNADYFYLGGMAVTADNMILTLGVYNQPNHPQVGFILRYKSTGQRDTTFGTNGIALIPDIWTTGEIYVSPTNKILHLCALYDSLTFGYKTTLIQWNADGTVDSSFANNGYAVFPAGTTQNGPRSGFLQADGKLTVFGNRQ